MDYLFILFFSLSLVCCLSVQFYQSLILFQTVYQVSRFQRFSINKIKTWLKFTYLSLFLLSLSLKVLEMKKNSELFYVDEMYSIASCHILKSTKNIYTEILWDKSLQVSLYISYVPKFNRIVFNTCFVYANLFSS